MVLLLTLCVLTIFLLIIPSIILYRLWWIPLCFQSFMESQGIRGPSYRFLHGNTKEIIKMKQQSKDAAAAMGLSHDIFPRVQPHFYSWTKLYGNIVLNWVGTQPEILVTEPELIKEILSNKEGEYPKNKVRGYTKKLFGDGLVMAQGDKWLKLRKLANHAFHGDCLKINMILYETLRLYSPASMIRRRVNSKVKLGKYVLPENLIVTILPLAVHRNPDIWGKDAHLFKPERFEGGLANATNGKATAFLGFGFGPRTCVGVNFAINEAKIALAMILQRYAFTLSPGYVHSPFMLLTVQPEHGVQIMLQPL